MLTLCSDRRLRCIRKKAAVVLVTVYLLLSCTVNASGRNAKDRKCSAVRNEWRAKGFGNVQHIPLSPVAGTQLKVCSAWGRSETCCTSQMETQLTTKAQGQYSLMADRFGVVKQNFSTKLSTFENYCTDLVDKSGRELHDMFTRTYGILYQQNSHVFSELFRDLRSYYRGGQLDLADILQGFFSSLLLRMFTLLNGQYVFDERYLGCIGERADELNAFGDVPQKLGVQVKRAFIAARTFRQGLAVGREAVNTLARVEMTSDCRNAITRMLYCPYCRGLANVKPCFTYCTDVMKTCQPTQHDPELADTWNAYIDAMLKVSDRLDGPFNIENVLDPMDVKISEAIMNFQENAEAVTAKVFQGCGQPSLGIRNKRDSEVSTRRPVRARTRTTAPASDVSGQPGVALADSEVRRTQRPHAGGRRKITSTVSKALSDTTTIAIEPLVRHSSTVMLNNVSSSEVVVAADEIYRDSSPSVSSNNTLPVTDDGWILMPVLSSASTTAVSTTSVAPSSTSTPATTTVELSQFVEHSTTSMPTRKSGRKSSRGTTQGRRRTSRPPTTTARPPKTTTKATIVNVENDRQMSVWDSGPDRRGASSGTGLERLIGDLRSMLNESRNFISRLSDSVCLLVSESRTNEDRCWNGTAQARYVVSENNDQTVRQSSAGNRKQNAAVSRVVYQLKTVIDKLRRAYNGLDVDWIDSDGSDDNSDSGNMGHYSPDDDFNDNEDDEDEYESSGSGFGADPSGGTARRFPVPMPESPYQHPPPRHNVDFYNERSPFPPPQSVTRRPIYMTTRSVYITSRSRAGVTRTNVNNMRSSSSSSGLFVWFGHFLAVLSMLVVHFGL